MYDKESVTISGKRKTSVAKATIRSGNGKITVNKLDYKNLNNTHRLLIDEPKRIAQEVLGSFNYDVSINVSGGGQESRIDACRLALGKAIVKITASKEVAKALTNYDRTILVADTRRKETNKPGDSKARAKRQTSFR